MTACRYRCSLSAAPAPMPPCSVPPARMNGRANGICGARPSTEYLYIAYCRGDRSRLVHPSGPTRLKEGSRGRPMADVVIRGGTIVDGSGNAPFDGDVAIRGGRI